MNFVLDSLINSPTAMLKLVMFLGLFLIVLNAIMLELTAFLVHGFVIQSFGWAIAAAVILGLISLVTNHIGRRE